jgi:hypothetical protein
MLSSVGAKIRQHDSRACVSRQSAKQQQDHVCAAGARAAANARVDGTQCEVINLHVLCTRDNLLVLTQLMRATHIAVEFRPRPPADVLLMFHPPLRACLLPCLEEFECATQEQYGDYF